MTDEEKIEQKIREVLESDKLKTALWMFARRVIDFGFEGKSYRFELKKVEVVNGKVILTYDKVEKKELGY